MSEKLPHDPEELAKALTRRYFFKQAGIVVGGTALSLLLRRDLFAADAASPGLPAPEPNPLAAKPSMFPARAKSVIYLFMAGAPSHLDLLDYKPKLQQYNGQLIPEEFTKGQRFAFIKGVPRLLGSPYKFSRSGKCGRGNLRAFAAPPGSCRRHRDCEIHRHHSIQSRPRTDLHELRFPDHRPSQHGFMAHLRSGKRVRRPAGIRGVAFRRKPARRRQVLLGKRVSSLGLSGCGIPLARRPRAVPR